MRLYLAGVRRLGLLLLPLLVACGSTPVSTGAAPSEPVRVLSAQEATELLAALPQVAEQERSVSYDAVSESALDGEQPRVEARLSGVLDTAVDAGTADVALVALDDLVAQAEAGGESEAAQELAALGRVRLSWDSDELTLLMGDERVSGPRDEADSGMYARIPGEPAGLFEVVASASDVEVEGREEVDGIATTHLRGSAQPRAAVEAGLGTQAQLAIAQLPELPVEVWVDGQGRPARIRYTVALPSLQEGRTRSIVTTYDYRGWGEPVDVTP